MSAEPPSIEDVPAEASLGEPGTAGVGTGHAGLDHGVNGSLASSGPPQGPPGPPNGSLGEEGMSDWEQMLPGNWLSRIGVVAVIIGLCFLVKMLYDRGLFGAVPQLVVGLAFGGLLLLAGHHWRSAYRGWAQALSGGGIAVLYLSLFSSYGLHHLMPFWVTFLLMFAVTLLGVGIALRRDSMAIAIIGIVGAFLVPIILGLTDRAGEDAGNISNNTELNIAYVLILDAGVAWLASVRNWHWLTFLSFGGSMAVFGWWYGTSDEGGVLGPSLGMLTGIFICFVAATMLFHGLWGRRPQLSDLALMTLNAAVYFGVSCHLLSREHGDRLGILSFCLAGLYAATAGLAMLRSRENGRLSMFSFAIGVVFLTVGIPLQLHGSYPSSIAPIWAAEGAALVLIAAWRGLPRLQVLGLAALVMAVVGLFTFGGAIDEGRFRPFVNETFWAFVITIAVSYEAAYFLRPGQNAFRPWFFPAVMLLASFLTLWLFSSGIVSYAAGRLIDARTAGSTGIDLRNIENARSLELVALWVGYGLCLLVAGTRKNWGWLRVAACCLMGVACGVTVVLLNHSHAMVRSGGSRAILNYSFGGFACCIVGLCAVAWVTSRYRAMLTSVERPVCAIVVAVANVLVLWAFTAEVVVFATDSANLRNMALVILWCAHASVLVLAGVWRSAPMARFAGYALMVAAGVLALVTLNHSQAGLQRTNSDPVINYSFGGLAVCVGTMYLAAYLMASRRRKLVDAERLFLPVLSFVADALCLFALSSEVLTYVSNGDGKSMGLTLLWAGYGVALIMVGFVGRWRWFRFGGLAVLTVAILKLFVVDTWTLHNGYRVATYLIVGFLLLAGGLVYHRHAETIKGLIMNGRSGGAGSAQS